MPSATEQLTQTPVEAAAYVLASAESDAAASADHEGAATGRTSSRTDLYGMCINAFCPDIL